MVMKIGDMVLAKFPTFMQKSGIGKNLMDALPVFMLPDCTKFASYYLLKLFARIRLHYIVTFGNREPSQEGSRNNKKYFKVGHLQILHLVTIGHELPKLFI